MPLGADWNFDLLEELIQDRGDQVVWETAIACPTCRREDIIASFTEVSPTEMTRIRQVNCRNCHGDGFIYRNAQVLTGLMTQINAGNRQLLPEGLALPGDFVFSPSLKAPDLHDMDKVTMLITDVLHEGQIIQRNGLGIAAKKTGIPSSLESTEDRLWYAGSGDVVWCEDENNVVYNVNTDFQIQNNKIVWIGNKPADGVFYTLKYHYYPEWIVYASPLQRVDRNRDLKQRVVLRKKHVVLANATEKATVEQRQAEQFALTGRINL